MKLPRRFESGILRPLERRAAGGLRIVEVGAGKRWLSGDLAVRGHRPVGLAASTGVSAGEAAFPILRAGIQAFPLTAARFDLVIFNGSFHHASDYWRTLQESRRLLDWNGRVVILNTPFFRSWREGEEAREEMRLEDPLAIGYLDPEMIRRLGRDLNIRWRTHKPWRTSPPTSRWMFEGWWGGE